MAKEAKYECSEQMVTPKAEALFIHLLEPDTEFATKDKPGEYKITLVFDPSTPEHRTFVDEMYEVEKDGKEKVEANGKKFMNDIFKPHMDKDSGEPTGKLMMTFHTQKKKTVWDANKVKMDEPKIGYGSICRVAFVTKPYDGMGGGVTCYLNAVQVVKLLEPQDSSDAFDIEGDGPVDDIPF